MNCHKCGRPMVGGAPHGPWPVQWECRPCNVFVGVDAAAGRDWQSKAEFTADRPHTPGGTKRASEDR